MTAAPPPLAPDLAAGLRRLKLAAMRQLAPELLITAKTQRWAPEELLRTLIDAEIAARDASNARTRMKSAAFPVTKTLDELRPLRLLHPRPHPGLPRLPGMDHRRREPLPGRPGRHRQEPRPGRPRRRRRPRRAQSPLLHRRRPGRDPLPRPGRQQRRQGHRHPAPQRPDPHRRSRVRPARRHRRPAAVPRSSPPPTNAAPWASPATGPSTSGAGSCPSTPPPSASSTGSCTTPASWSPTATPTACAKPEPKGGTTLDQDLNQPEGWGLLTGHQRGPQLGH